MHEMVPKFLIHTSLHNVGSILIILTPQYTIDAPETYVCSIRVYYVLPQFHLV